MRGIRRFQLAPAAMLMLLVLLGSTPNLGAQESPSGQNAVHFLFAAGAQMAKQGDSKPVALGNQTILNSGDRIKFFWEPQSPAFFYLFHLGSNGNLSLLFPADLNQSQAPAGRPVYVPEGSLWFELDATSGMEKFFFLASKSRLNQLEGLYAHHTALTDRAEIQSSAQAILDEISNLTKKRKSLAAPAETPVRIAGKQRGQQKPDSVALPDITPFAKEIVAPDFYSKTFTIEHR